MVLDDHIRRVRAIIVLRAARYARPRAVVEALVGAGFPIVEFTLTGDNALDAIEQTAVTPGAIVGAGSVTTVPDAQRCVDVGARFIVSPVTAVELADLRAQVPVLLAGFTPSEVHTAWVATEGSPVKLFPASSGGIGHLRAITGPLPDVPLIPSGGIGVHGAAAYLDAGAVAVNVGSAVAPPSALEAGDVSEVRRRAEELRAAILGRA